MFDFGGHPNNRLLFLDDQTGVVVGDHDHGGNY
jgi:hypothetical protein